MDAYLRGHVQACTVPSVFAVVGHVLQALPDVAEILVFKRCTLLCLFSCRLLRSCFPHLVCPLDLLFQLLEGVVRVPFSLVCEHTVPPAPCFGRTRAGGAVHGALKADGVLELGLQSHPRCMSTARLQVKQ